MGSKTFDGVRFAAWSDDHDPPHVHGYYAGITVIVSLADGRVRLARRKDRVKPLSAKKSDVNHVLRTAQKFAGDLFELWEVARG